MKARQLQSNFISFTCISKNVLENSIKYNEDKLVAELNNTTMRCNDQVIRKNRTRNEQEVIRKNRTQQHNNEMQ